MKLKGYEKDILSEICKDYNSNPMFGGSMRGATIQREIGDPTKFMNYLKELFFNKKSNNWGIKKAVRFVRENKLSPENFTQFLNDFIVLLSNENIEQKKFSDFVAALGKTQKLYDPEAPSLRHKIKLKDSVDILTFLEDINEVADKHLTTKHRSIVKLIYHNIETNLEYSYLEKLYYDQVVNKK